MAGNQPSWKTDVHRAPTKKWAEAKSYNYEGDDWGGYDEYNEYGTYDEPPPLPKAAPAATGYRHRGQSISNQNPLQTQGLIRSDSFDAGDEKRNFSAGHSAASSAFQGVHSSSQQGQGQLDGQYETHHQQSQPESQYHMYQQHHQNEDLYDIQQAHRQHGDQYDDYQEPHQPEFRRDVHQQTQDYLPNQTYDTRNVPNPNYAPGETQASYQRRDFSPSAPLQPLHSHTKSMPMNPTVDAQAKSQFPPRKSSLSGSRPLHLPVSQSAQSPLQSSNSRPEVLAEPASQFPQPPTQNRSPFIRPADIYKRMEQERSRERERAAAEARRPSAGSTSDQSAANIPTTSQPAEGSRRSTDSNSDRPARSHLIAPPSPEARASSVSPARLDSSGSEPQEVANEKASVPAIVPASAAAVRPSLTTIPEQRSEYGLLGFSVTNPLLARAIGANVYGTSARRINMESADHDDNDGNNVTSATLEEETEPVGDINAGRSPPSLPQVNRVSGFGSDIWGGVAGSTNQQNASNIAETSPEIRDEQTTSFLTGDHSESSDGLHHQPSSGFHTVVAHAFDRGAERHGPKSQVSTEGRLDATNESDLSRSNTDSTAGISPIISRFPLGFGKQEQTQEREEPTSITSRIAQEPENPDLSETRPLSTDTVRGQQSGFAGRHSRDPSAGSAASGYRHKLDVPSPGNSPARTPAIESEPHIHQETVGQIESAGPSTEYHEPVHTSEPDLPDLHGSSLATREADLADAVNAHSDTRVAGAGPAAQQAQTDFIKSRHESDAASRRLVESLANDESPPVRAGSPSKSRVRVLAEKYDDLNLSRQSTAQSPTGSVASWSGSRRRSPSPKRNVGGASGSDQERGYSRVYDESDDHHEPDSGPSFDRRPRLPGEWISYADTPGSSRQSDSEDQDEETSIQDETPKPHRNQSGALPASIEEPTSQEVDLSPNTEKRRLDGKSLDSSISDPMAALAAAGSAMAASFMSTIGLTSPESESESDTNKSWDSSDDERTPDAVDRGPVGESVHNDTDRVQRDVPADETEDGNKITSMPEHSEPSSKHSSLNASYNQSSSLTQPHRMEIPTRPVQPSFSSVMSTESSPDDTENDRLSKQIVRSLSPTSFGIDLDKHSQSQASQISTNQRSSAFDSRESTLLPREYDSYWAEKGHEINESEMAIPQTQVSADTSSGKDLEDDEMVAEPQHQLKQERTVTPPTITKAEKTESTPTPPVSQSGFIDKRFSFEKREETTPFSQTFDTVTRPIESTHATTTERPHQHTEGVLSYKEISDADNAASPVQPGRFDISSLLHAKAWEGVQHDSKIQSLQPAATSKDVTASDDSDDGHAQGKAQRLDSESNHAESNIPDLKGASLYQGSTAPLLPPIDFSRGVNQGETSPQQVGAESQQSSNRIQDSSSELPTKDLSVQHSTSASLDQYGTRISHDSPIGRDDTGRFSPKFGHGETTPVSKGLRFPDPPAWMVNPSESHPDFQQRLTPFKEIMTMKHSGDRIQTYQDTREGFATMHTGLSDWLSHMVKADPGLAHIEPVQTRPTGSLAGTVLHKISPSVAKFTRSNTSGGSSQQQPYYQQYLDSAAMVPGQGSADASSAAASEEQYKTSRRPSMTGQSKGKDILHSAGLLGGRATSSAKGFFAKSRSKFKGNSSDKSSTPRSISTEQQEAHSSGQSTRSQSVAQATVQATPIATSTPTPTPTQVEEPTVLVGTAISGDADIPAGYGAAQLAPGVPVLPNDDSLSPRVSHGKLELHGISSDTVHPDGPARKESRSMSRYGKQNVAELESGNKTALQQGHKHRARSQEARPVEAQNDQQINLRIDSPEETATAGMTKYVRSSNIMRESVSSLDSSSDSGATPVSEVGVFGPRGLALWTNTSSGASRGQSHSSLLRQYQNQPLPSVQQFAFGTVSDPAETYSNAYDIRKPSIRDYDSRETIRGQAIGTPADLQKHNRRHYFEKSDEQAEINNQMSSIAAFPVSPISRPESTIVARGRPMSPSQDSELGHLQVVPQNQTRLLNDLVQTQRPFTFNFRRVSEDSSLKPDDSASQRPRDSVQDSLSQRHRSSVQESISQIPHSSVQSSSVKPAQPRISEAESRPSQSDVIPLDGSKPDKQPIRSGQITGPPPPSNIDDLPVSVRKHYRRFDSQTSETPAKPSGESTPRLEDNHIPHGVGSQQRATDDLPQSDEQPITPTATPRKRRMSPFERFRSRSRSRGRTLNDFASDVPSPLMRQSEQELANIQPSALETETKPVSSPTLRRRRRISSPFNLLRGRSRPRSEVEADDMPVPPIPHTAEGQKPQEESPTVATPSTRESFYAAGKRRLSSPFRRLRSRSRGRSDLPSEEVPALPTLENTRVLTSRDDPATVSVVVKGSQIQSTKDRGKKITKDSASLGTPSGDREFMKTEDDHSPNQAMKSRETKPKRRDRSLSWNRLGNRFTAYQSTTSADEALVPTESQRRSWGAGLAGCFSTTDDEKPTLIARDSQHHLTNFTHEIPVPVSRSKSDTTIAGETSFDQNAQSPGNARLRSHSAVPSHGIGSDMQSEQVNEVSKQNRTEQHEFRQSHNTVRRRPTAAEKGKSVQRVELPGGSPTQNSSKQKQNSMHVNVGSRHGLVDVPSTASNNSASDKIASSPERKLYQQTAFRSSVVPISRKRAATLSAQLDPPPGLRGIQTINISEPLDFFPKPTSPTVSARRMSLHNRSSSAHSQPAIPYEQHYQPMPSTRTQPSSPQLYPHGFQNEKPGATVSTTLPASRRSSMSIEHYLRPNSGSQPASPVISGPYKSPQFHTLPYRTDHRQQQPAHTTSPVSNGPYLPLLRTRPQSVYSTSEQRQSPLIPPPRSPFRPPSITTSPRSSVYSPTNAQHNFEENPGGWSASREYQHSEVSRNSGLYDASNKGGLRLETSNLGSSPGGGRTKRRLSQSAFNTPASLIRDRDEDEDYEGVVMNSTSYPGMEWKPAGLENE